MVMNRIPLSYNILDHESLTAVLSKYADKPHDALISDFESALTTAIGTSMQAVALNSGTAAIHLALKALGVGAGDEVMVSNFTFVATVNPILYLGAHPVFIDSERDTWNMDPELLRKALREHTAKSPSRVKAILVVDAYGMPAKWNELLAVAREFNVPVIEDAAEAVGSHYHGKPAGTLADIGIFSFNNNKLLTTFGGGAVITSNPKWAEQIRFWSSQSLIRGSLYAHAEIGYNYRMSPLAAAYGLSQIEKLSTNINYRVEIFEKYLASLTGSGLLDYQKQPDKVYSNRWLPTFCFPEAVTPTLVQLLDKQMIETRSLWNPMHLQSPFIHEKAFLSGVSEALFKTGICLPSGTSLTPSMQKEIIDLISKSLGY